jgi:surfactin synthase thioesterase subunit
VNPSQRPWLNFLPADSETEMRLFCFPYAGGGASIFRSWAAALSPQIEVCAIQYPGRETRSNEPCVQNITQIAEAFGLAMLPFLDKPFALFGHSMGALVSFEVARFLSLTNGPLPEHVFFSASGAPHIQEPNPIHHLSEVEFTRALVRLNGIPTEVLKSVEMLKYMLPILRADFAACETYRYREGAPLRCPMSIFGGDHDSRVDRGRLGAWSDHADGYFSLVMFPADHFFLRTCQTALLNAINHELRPLMASSV